MAVSKYAVWAMCINGDKLFKVDPTNEAVVEVPFGDCSFDVDASGGIA